MDIQTVLGPIQADDLGETLMHEHVTCADWSMRMNFGAQFFEHDQVVAMAAGQFDKVKQLGVKTVVDGTPINLGRDVRLIREVAQKTGLNFIVSSGFYYQEEPWLLHRDETQIFDLLLHECREGIAGTGILPGIMKAGVSDLGLTSLTRKLLTVTARVAKEVQLPIFCHHDTAAKSALEIMELFSFCGVPANRVILGHCGDTNDLSYLESVLKQGCYIGIDRLGYCEIGNSLENCVKIVLHLSGLGYLNRIMLSHDFAAYLAFWDSWETTKSADYLNLAVDYTLIHKHFLPALRAGGMKTRDIEQLLIVNPKNFFSGNN